MNDKLRRMEPKPRAELTEFEKFKNLAQKLVLVPKDEIKKRDQANKNASKTEAKKRRS